MSFSLQTSGPQAGHAVTVWWMVFNPDGSLSVQYAAGHAIAHLQVGDTDGAINGGPGLLDAQGPEVVLVVLDHGPKDPGRVSRQLHTVDVCNPTCTDLQMSIHTAG